MTKTTTLKPLIEKAEVILYLNGQYNGILPKTTVMRLTRAVKPHADRAMHSEQLREAIRLAELYKSKFEAALAEDAELEKLLAEDVFAETVERCMKLRDHPEVFLSAGVTGVDQEITAFLAELSDLMTYGVLDVLLQWETQYKNWVLIVEKRTEERATIIDKLSTECIEIRVRLRALESGVNPIKKDKFEIFMSKLDDLLNCGSLEGIQAWLKQAEQRELQLRPRVNNRQVHVAA